MNDDDKNDHTADQHTVSAVETLWMPLSTVSHHDDKAWALAHGSDGRMCE